ncbi:hypothetical protein BU23DRAFT_598839 [Bimuria novae-zelandiae CBS 107.79]|uniref:Uncharacterized protein n=1 Tax=Bimuria novae-zelandiae CBS 107.79 TaxID=1447943 RepID=A0A6A5V9A4_9PLEO|nr:hypothetical protein BU23DRAFT_598839 [Bimuria novae-zelandiae CBS 107.79]
MPPQRTSGRPNDSRNLTEAQKGAIVALRKLSNTEYAYIAGAMGLSISTLQKVFKKVEKAFPLELNLSTYNIKELTRYVLQEVGITVSRPTLVKIAHEHRDHDHTYAIIRGVRPKKPELNDDNIRNRERYVA